MKTPLLEGDKLIHAMLLEHWNVYVVTIHFIPIGDSAYSYKIETEGGNYYLKIVDRQTASGRRTADRMEFALPLQRFISERPHAGVDYQERDVIRLSWLLALCSIHIYRGNNLR